MSVPVSIVRKLQTDSINPDVSVSSLLRAAKVIATKLDLHDALVWINRELDGYLQLQGSELPTYRLLTGELKCLNPYHGWQPIHFEDAEEAKAFSQAPIGSPIGAIEEEVKGRGPRKGTVIFNLPAATKTELVKSLDIPMDVQLRLNHGGIYGILDAVRNLVLNWTLELENAGILGEDMEFTSVDKKEAGPITQQFFAQNIGVVGPVSDNARVSNQQTATIAVTLDLAALKDFVAQAQRALPLLPDEVSKDLEPTVNAMETELVKEKPDQGKLRELMLSARQMCEGAAGNLATEGILGMLKLLWGS